MLRLVLPKGSLERATLELFEAADLARHRGRPTSTTAATIDDPRVDEVRILRPQEIPRYVAEGLFDLGITGRDWIEETGSRGRDARRAALLEGHGPARSASCSRCAADSPCETVERPARRACACHTEYPELTRRFFEKHGIDADIRLSYGATEAKVPDIADAVVEITETGRALRAAGLQDHRHDPRVVHRADRQPGRLRRPREAPRDGAAPDAARGRARGPRARCW